MSKATNATCYSYTVDGELTNFSEAKWNRFVEKTVKEGHAAPVPEKVQTFVIHEAETPIDFSELVPSADIQVTLFNRGASLKQLTEIRTLMEDSTFVTSESPYDLSEALNAVTERRSANPEDKVNKLLEGLDENALARIMAKLMEKTTAPGARV